MCGIFAIWSKKLNVSEATYFGLFSLQHRGQESAGIAVSDGKDIQVTKQLGLVSQVFTRESLDNLKGFAAVGHSRYSTTGSTTIQNAQPVMANFHNKPVAIAHNGNLINTEELRKKCEEKGFKFKGTSDTEVIAALLGISAKKELEDAVLELMGVMRGAYSIVFLALDKMIAVRDTFGIRPLVIGSLEDGYVVASEDCALSVVGAVKEREIMPGELFIIDKKGVNSRMCLNPSNKKGFCSFEYIYFARPDSVFNNKSLYSIRVKMGRNLFREHPVEADAVISVPDSGTPAAIGYSKESGIPFAEGLIKNRYIGRTFIQPEQLLREVGVKLKLNPIVDAVKGKKIVIVDDSIVRGTTSKKIVKLLRDTGAKEVHFRVSSPMVMNPCFYGIDTASKKELIAANMSLEKIQEELDVDSIGYLSLQGLLNAIHLPKDNLCLACFNGEYPIEIADDMKHSKFLFDEC
ncbi:MAG: amidophosphoribosyltransferase [Candidatus Margulisbacteria bacterium]|nr:amidophosphoribosyltransferase [Candidatus Margulisiibacteriota bacterium]